MSIISINVLGTPAPKGSSRAFYKAGMKRAVIVKDNSERQKGWDRNVRETALEQLGPCLEPKFVQTPLCVELQFRLLRPAGHWGKGKNASRFIPSAPIAPIGKPDIDKLARSTLDALIGLAFDDDSRIVSLLCTKTYAAPGQEGCLIVVREYDRDTVISFVQQLDTDDDDVRAPAQHSFLGGS
jgi:Holliday junction resolvase RusA-like endonuclease